MALSPPHSRGPDGTPARWVLGQPAWNALLEDMFADAVHHRSNVDVLFLAEGQQGCQLLFGLLLVHAVQVEVDLRRIAAALELFQLEF